MFSSQAKLDKRTPEGGINREEYINLLAGEFYESSSAGKVEKKECRYFLFIIVEIFLKYF